MQEILSKAGSSEYFGAIFESTANNILSSALFLEYTAGTPPVSAKRLSSSIVSTLREFLDHYSFREGSSSIARVQRGI